MFELYRFKYYNKVLYRIPLLTGPWPSHKINFVVKLSSMTSRPRPNFSDNNRYLYFCTGELNSRTAANTHGEKFSELPLHDLKNICDSYHGLKQRFFTIDYSQEAEIQCINNIFYFRSIAVFIYLMI